VTVHCSLPTKRSTDSRGAILLLAAADGVIALIPWPPRRRARAFATERKPAMGPLLCREGVAQLLPRLELL
jgi:hypothetical protein